MGSLYRPLINEDKVLTIGSFLEGDSERAELSDMRLHRPNVAISFSKWRWSVGNPLLRETFFVLLLFGALHVAVLPLVCRGKCVHSIYFGLTEAETHEVVACDVTVTL